MEEVVTICCPSCLQHTALTIELVPGRHRLVEDCQNCCEPIELEAEVRAGEVVRLDYRLAN